VYAKILKKNSFPASQFQHCRAIILVLDKELFDVFLCYFIGLLHKRGGERTINPYDSEAKIIGQGIGTISGYPGNS
jgi:hypothetical protein